LIAPFYGKNHEEMTGHNIFYEFSNMQKKYLKNALFRGFFDTFNIKSYKSNLLVLKCFNYISFIA